MAFTYEVKEKYGIVSNRRMNNIELRLISWGNGEPKYDIRGWYEYNGEERCTKGVSFSGSEMEQFVEIINSIDFSKQKPKVFGEIQQSGKCSTKIQLNKYGYDIRVYNGNFGIKGVTFNKADMQKLLELVNGIFQSQTETEPEEKADLFVEWKAQSDDERVIHALASIPVNDGNYPIKTATVYQLTKAIEQMESEPNGHHKTRLMRCKAKLAQLTAREAKKTGAKTETEVVVEDKPDDVEDKPDDVHDEPEVTESEPDTVQDDSEAAEDEPEEVKEKPEIADGSKAKPDKEKKGIIIQFPKKDAEPVLKFEPSEVHHTYEEAEAKLKADRAKFDPNPDHDYVIEGVLEACVADQDLLDNVMRPEKSYVGAFQYLFEKARQGYCTKVGNNVGIMDKNDALRYTIDYFNTDEEKVKAKKEAEVKKKKAEAKKKEAAAKKKVEVKKTGSAPAKRRGRKPKAKK